jgi:hypothetical protein
VVVVVAATGVAVLVVVGYLLDLVWAVEGAAMISSRRRETALSPIQSHGGLGQHLDLALSQGPSTGTERSAVIEMGAERGALRGTGVEKGAERGRLLEDESWIGRGRAREHVMATGIWKKIEMVTESGSGRRRGAGSGLTNRVGLPLAPLRHLDLLQRTATMEGVEAIAAGAPSSSST